MTKLQELNEKMAAVRKEIRELAKSKGKEIVREIVQPLWDAVLHGICVTGYIPGFNDGDPCVFSVSDTCLLPEGFDPGSDSPDDEGQTTGFMFWYKEAEDAGSRYQKSAQESVDSFASLGINRENGEAIEALLKSVSAQFCNSEDFMEQAFGSNFQLFIFADGRWVLDEDYDCGY